MVVLPPNPPPISAGMTLMRPGSHPITLAVMERTAKCPCEEHHTTDRPSSPVSATTACGSM